MSVHDDGQRKLKHLPEPNITRRFIIKFMRLTQAQRASNETQHNQQRKRLDPDNKDKSVGTHE